MRIDKPYLVDKGVKVILFNVAGMTFVPNCNKIFSYIYNNYACIEEDLFNANPKLPPINLIPEPENEYDKNAIRIEVRIKNKRGKYKNIKVGYVPRGDEDNPDFNIEIGKIIKFKKTPYKAIIKDFYYRSPNNSLNTPDVYATISFRWKPNKLKQGRIV